MSRSISRKQFLLGTAASTGALFVAGCGEESPQSTRTAGGGAAGNSGTGGGAGSASGGASGGSASAGGGSGGSGGSGGTAGTTTGGTGGSSGSAGAGGLSSGGGGSGGGTSNSCLADAVAEISCPHEPPHELTVPMADILAGATKSYDIKGQAGHSHPIELSSADFAVLRAGGTVFKFTEAGDNQDHCVTLSCATASDPEASGQCNAGNAFSC